MIIGVTGGKGGTGKSTVATALAVELAKTKKILLADMDVECPNDHLILSIKKKEIKKIEQRIPEFDLSKCSKCGICGTVCKTKAIVSIKDKEPIFIPEQCNGCGACFITCPVKAISWDKKEIGKIYSGKNYRVDFISGELKIREPVSEFIVDEIKELIEKIKKNYDFIILDTAAGTHCDVISSLDYCNNVLAITEPSPLGMHDVELIIKLCLKLKKPFEVILNRYEKENEHIITKMLKKYNKKIFARIPYKKEIMEQYSKGVPIEDESIKKITEIIKNGYN
ncbi:ATP-binding protein [Candidatus Woesearchaeota archaeon]|nr:ATP-binding protein [Candidatus Woesearchaeota archaeon]